MKLEVWVSAKSGKASEMWLASQGVVVVVRAGIVVVGILGIGQRGGVGDPKSSLVRVTIRNGVKRPAHSMFFIKQQIHHFPT